MMKLNCVKGKIQTMGKHELKAPAETIIHIKAIEKKVGKKTENKNKNWNQNKTTTSQPKTITTSQATQAPSVLHEFLLQTVNFPLQLKKSKHIRKPLSHHFNFVKPKRRKTENANLKSQHRARCCILSPADTPQPATDRKEIWNFPWF